MLLDQDQSLQWGLYNKFLHNQGVRKAGYTVTHSTYPSPHAHLLTMPFYPTLQLHTLHCTFTNATHLTFAHPALCTFSSTTLQLSTIDCLSHIGVKELVVESMQVHVPELSNSAVCVCSYLQVPASKQITYSTKHYTVKLSKFPLHMYFSFPGHPHDE